MSGNKKSFLPTQTHYRTNMSLSQTRSQNDVDMGERKSRRINIDEFGYDSNTLRKARDSISDISASRAGGNKTNRSWLSNNLINREIQEN